MYRTLLVPLDGSTFGEHALPSALSIARRAGATLQVAHVHTPPLGDVEGFGGLVDEKVRESERVYLDAVVKRFGAVATVPVNSTLLNGSVADALHDHALATGADLVVMTTHGRGPLTRFWLGSVADELVRRMLMPILLVRPQEAAPDFAGEKSLRHVLIPLDGSALAEQVIEPAVNLCCLMQADCTLLRVIQPTVIGRHDPADAVMSGLDRSVVKQLQALHEQERNDAGAYLKRIAERLPAQTLHVQTRVVVNEQPAAAILEEVRAHGVDLIALATHGRGGLTRLLLGSVADKVLRGASTPVLVYRPLGG